MAIKITHKKKFEKTTYFKMVRYLVLFKLSHKYPNMVINVQCQKLETLNFTTKHTKYEFA